MRSRRPRPSEHSYIAGTPIIYRNTVVAGTGTWDYSAKSEYRGLAYSDPFGLCPQWLTGRPCSGAVDVGAGFVPGVSTGIDIATAVSGQNPLTGEQVGWVGRGIALAGVLTPASGGQIRGAAKAIAEGHAFVKHVLVRGEFAGLGNRTTKQMGQFVDDIMSKASGADVRKLSGGRTAYWDDATGTVVIHNPRARDQGTVFRPTTGRDYFDNDLR